MPSEGSKVKHIQLSFPASSYMYCDVSGFPESFHNVMYGTWWKTSILSNFALWNVIFYLFFWWNLAQSDEPWSSFACKDWNAPFMPKHDTLTCYQFTYLLWTVTKEFNMDNHFTFIFNFFVMCCSRQKKNVFIFTKYIYVGQWKLWKSHLCHFVN